MLYTTEAVVVKTVRYGETHAIVTLLTPSGLVSAMARGAMKPQSRLMTGTKLGAQGLYFLYQGKGLGNLQQVELADSRRRLHAHLEAAAYAAYFCELVLHTAPQRPDGDVAMYREFTSLLDALCDSDKVIPILARVWETKICRWVGASPDWRICMRCTEPLVPVVRYHSGEGGLLCGRCYRDSDARQSFLVPDSTGKLLYLFERTTIERLGQITISLATQHALKQTLYYQLTDFAGMYLKSRSVLEQISDTLNMEEGE